MFRFENVNGPVPALRGGPLPDKINQLIIDFPLFSVEVPLFFPTKILKKRSKYWGMAAWLKRTYIPKKDDRQNTRYEQFTILDQNPKNRITIFTTIIDQKLLTWTVAPTHGFPWLSVVTKSCPSMTRTIFGYPHDFGVSPCDAPATGRLGLCHVHLVVAGAEQAKILLVLLQPHLAFCWYVVGF